MREKPLTDHHFVPGKRLFTVKCLFAQKVSRIMPIYSDLSKTLCIQLIPFMSEWVGGWGLMKFLTIFSVT